MTTTEAFLAIWYKCPDCDEENTIRITPSQPSNGFFASSIGQGKCKKCKSTHSINELYETLANNPNFDSVNPGAAEFICEECGTTSVVVVKNTAENLPGGMIFTGKFPDNGTCKFCNTKYKLDFGWMKQGF